MDGQDRIHILVYHLFALVGDLRVVLMTSLPHYFYRLRMCETYFWALDHVKNRYFGFKLVPNFE